MFFVHYRLDIAKWLRHAEGEHVPARRLSLWQKAAEPLNMVGMGESMSDVLLFDCGRSRTSVSPMQEL